jgi:hypothetical protein
MEPACDNTGVSKEDVPLEIHNTRSTIRCCSSQLRSAANITTKAATVFREKYKPGHQSNLRLVCANVNINATADVFLAFTAVQQTATELSGAATEKEKVAVITKAVIRLLKNNASINS